MKPDDLYHSEIAVDEFDATPALRTAAPGDRRCDGYAEG
jgi:hypothetical protein